MTLAWRARRSNRGPTDGDLTLILAGLFELRITHLEDADRCATIDALAKRLGGDPAAMFYGAAR